MIPLSRPQFGEEEFVAARRAMESGWISRGPECNAFEALIRQYLGVPAAVTVNNCTAALYVCLKYLSIPEGREVIVPDFGFPAAALALLQAGLVPVFVDVDLETFQMRMDCVEEAISTNTAAIIPIHMFGSCCDMDTLMDMCRGRIYVIEDAACALGAEYRGAKAGTIGDFGCYSLHARKGITTGEGGIIVSKHTIVEDSILKQANCGCLPTFARTTPPEFDVAGFNFRMSDILAAIGTEQLKKCDAFIAGRKQAATRWMSFIKDYSLDKDIFPQKLVAGSNHIYQTFVVRIPDKNVRKEFVEILNSYGIETGIGSYATHTLPVFRKSKYVGEDISVELSASTVSLPVFPGLFDLIEGAYSEG